MSIGKDPLVAAAKAADVAIVIGEKFSTEGEDSLALEPAGFVDALGRCCGKWPCHAPTP